MNEPYTDADVQAGAAAVIGHGALPKTEVVWECQCGFICDNSEQMVAHQVRVLLDVVAPAIVARGQIDILKSFSKHDIHGLLPHCDISNSWYHRGIDGAQSEADTWADYVQEGIFYEGEKGPTWPDENYPHTETGD